MHLTNYAINKNSPNFIFNESHECKQLYIKSAIKGTKDRYLQCIN
jgi:hypothetical protein